MTHLTRYVCPDKDCQHYGRIEDTSRKFFHDHIFEKPKEKLIDIAIEYGILENPYFESKYSLVKAIVDFCREFAIRISNQELDQNELNNYE